MIKRVTRRNSNKKQSHSLLKKSKKPRLRRLKDLDLSLKSLNKIMRITTTKMILLRKSLSLSKKLMRAKKSPSKANLSLPRKKNRPLSKLKR